MKHLSTEVLDEIKNKLSEEKKRLEEELGQFSAEDKKIKGDYHAKFPDYGDDEDENANEVAEFSDRLSLECILEKELKDVNDALKRIEDGTYGVDIYTGEPIEQERLLARPTSNTSVESKKKFKGES